MSGFEASTHGVMLDAMEGYANARRVALFLDLDGTLCPFCVDPQAVRLTAGQHCVLERLYDLLDGALCVLSGRSLQDLCRVFDGMRLGLIGGHGAEGLTALGSSEDQRQLLHAEQAMLKLSDPDAGIWIERKPHACALHYRASPQRGPALGAQMRELVAPLFALRLLEGDCVYEVLPSGVGKGTLYRRVGDRAGLAQPVELALRRHQPRVDDAVAQRRPIAADRRVEPLPTVGIDGIVEAIDPLDIGTEARLSPEIEG